MFFHRMPDDADDSIRVSLDFGPAGGKGPPIDPDLFRYATSSRRAFYALLQLTVEWWQPGLTRTPVGKRKSGLWGQMTDADKRKVRDRYDASSHQDVISLTAPFATNKNTRETYNVGIAAMKGLANDGKLQLVELKGGNVLFLPSRPVLDDPSSDLAT